MLRRTDEVHEMRSECRANDAHVEASNKARDNFATSLIRGFLDHFNPALHTMEEAVSVMAKRSKRRR